MKYDPNMAVNPYKGHHVLPCRRCGHAPMWMGGGKRPEGYLVFCEYEFCDQKPGSGWHPTIEEAEEAWNQQNA